MKQMPVKTVLFFTAFSLLGSCVSPPEQTGGAGPDRTEARRELVRTEPGEAPEWKNSLPQNGAEIYFVGVSRFYDTEAEARNAAREDAFTQIVKYYGQCIQAAGIERSSLAGRADDILNPYIEREEEITRFAQAVVSQVGADRYYTEVYLDSKNREAYIVYVLCQINRARAERDIDNFAETVSTRYGALIGAADDLVTALKVYAGIYEALRGNPLHRAVAWYDGGGGRAGLYEYCAARINALANGVSFAAIPYGSVQKGETLHTTVRVSSPQFQRVGGALCRVSMTVGGEVLPSRPYTVGQDNTFSLLIYTDKLEAGKYNVQLELLLSEAAPQLRVNPSAGFSFEVTPLNTIRFIFQDGEAARMGPKIEELLQGQGLLTVDSGAAYLALVKLEFSERQEGNYCIVRPHISISIELERDRTPLVSYTKRYGEFRHATRNEALERAYRNIESDLRANFAEQIRGLGK
jgi:hypothetical protein